jgi:hypothetical protein
MPVVHRFRTHLAYWPEIRKFFLKRPMRALDAHWNHFLHGTAMGRLESIQEWTQLQEESRVNVADSLQKAKKFFCDGLTADGFFRFDRQWICATKPMETNSSGIIFTRGQLPTNRT